MSCTPATHGNPVLDQTFSFLQLFCRLWSLRLQSRPQAASRRNVSSLADVVILMSRYVKVHWVRQQPFELSRVAFPQAIRLVSERGCMAGRQPTAALSQIKETHRKLPHPEVMTRLLLQILNKRIFLILVLYSHCLDALHLALCNHCWLKRHRNVFPTRCHQLGRCWQQGWHWGCETQGWDRLIIIVLGHVQFSRAPRWH